MKTKFSILTLMVGVATFAMAQSAHPTGSSGSAAVQSAPGISVQGNNGQNQTIPSQSPDQMNRVLAGASTNSNATSVNTNWPSSYNGNNGATNGDGVSGMNEMMETNKFNPYANYTNPNSTYVNPNSTNVNPYATYTNPYAIDNNTNSSLNTNGSSGYYGHNETTNLDNLTGMTNVSGINTNSHHWWKWW